MSKAIYVKPTPKCSTAQSTHIVEYISVSLAEILRFCDPGESHVAAATWPCTYTKF